MQHIMVKLAIGKSEEQKIRLTEAIVQDTISALGIQEEAVSVAIEEIRPEDWTEQVYQPDIRGDGTNSTRNRGNGPLAK
jgi:4-oxalocrotonate tautomerase